MAIFEIKNLGFSYPDALAPALTGIDVSIEAGEFVAICGKSGCGKSTLLRHFKTALTPYGAHTGEVLFEGRLLEDVTVREQASGIGYVLQSPDAQIVTDKVWHELAFGLENLGLEQRAIRLRVAEMASYFGIQEWFHKRVEELSGGQKQLLNLASVMAMQPRVLVLDEPTSQLDPIAASDFLRTVHKINTDLGVTVIVVEHRLEDVMPMADKVLVLEEGRQLLYGGPRSVGRALAGSDLFLAMPSPMRIYDGVALGSECPLTVREGRRWLDEQVCCAVGDAREASVVAQACEGDAHEAAAAEDIAGEASVGEVSADAAASARDDDVVIRCRDLWFRYERNAPDVVRGLSMEVHRGEFFCLLGGNGTGKSTSLSLLAGTQVPYRGKVWIEGRELSRRGNAVVLDASVAVLPQNPQCLFVEDTVRADLAEMFAERPLVTAGEREAAIARVVEQTEIAHLLDRHPYDLSGGEQQRAALAKLLLLSPRILMLDEPTKGLDGFYKEKLARIFARLCNAGTTILMVSHDVEFCAEYASRCALFFDGAIVAEKPTREFFRGNSFYTTAANRMARHLFPDAVTVEEVIAACKSATQRA